MRTQLATVAIVALLVLAGCSSGGGGGTATEAETTDTATATETTTGTATGTDGATVEATATAEATVTAGTGTDGTDTDGTSSPANLDTSPPQNLDPVSSMSNLPDGVEEGETANVSAVLASTDRQKNSNGYVLDATFINSTQSEERGFTIRNESGASGAINVTGDLNLPFNGSARIDSYGDKDVIAYRIVTSARGRTASNVTYATGDGFTGFFVGFLIFGYELQDDTYLKGADWKPVGVDTSGSEDLVVLNATSLNTSRYEEGGFSVSSPAGQNESLKDVSGVMYVDQSGVVERANVSYTLERDDGTTYQKGIALTYETGGVSVSEPAWTSEAPQVEASLNSDSTLMTLEHTGGAAIPAGTTINVTNPSFMGADTNVTVNQEVTQGETMYIYLTGNNTDPVAQISVGSQPSVPSDAVEFGSNVEVEGKVDGNTFAAAPPDEDS